MSPTAVPARITVDFRESLHPARGWILGVRGEASRVELLAFEGRPAAPESFAPPVAVTMLDCTCPEFCDRDHDVD
jgi:hypothetical protein